MFVRPAAGRASRPRWRRRWPRRLASLPEPPSRDMKILRCCRGHRRRGRSRSPSRSSARSYPAASLQSGGGTKCRRLPQGGHYW